MCFSTSSRVIPIPLSDTVKVPASLSAFTRTRKLEASPLNSPEDANTFNFCVASTAFDTISRRKIS